MAERAVDVLVQIAGEDVHVGRLWSHRGRRSESQSFSYRDDYLARPHAYALDLALPLVSGQQQTPAGREIFGAFSDCAPDRWGRRLIARADRLRADLGGGPPPSRGEIDVLLGVRDDLRQGALRFRSTVGGPFLADERSGVPHLLALPKLLNAAERLERDEASEAELSALLRGGSSLGGARPKAHVLDASGRLAIAKFPSPANDEWDVMAWEAITSQLARRAGITVPTSALHLIDGKSILIVDRFDRVGERRIGYVSAMTMLEASDGESGSYLEIVDVIERFSPQARHDLHELWRRIAFSILVSNFDDHLRNHGFLRTSSAGWTLSPAFDLNPDPRPGRRELSTAIDFDDARPRIDTLVDVAGTFRLDGAQARAILAQVVNATDAWRAISGQVAAPIGGLRPSAIDQMAPAFEHDQAARARELASS